MLGNVLQIAQKKYPRTRIGKPTSNKNKGNATDQPTGLLHGGGRLGGRLGWRLGGLGLGGRRLSGLGLGGRRLSGLGLGG